MVWTWPGSVNDWTALQACCFHAAGQERCLCDGLQNRMCGGCTTFANLLADPPTITRLLILHQIPEITRLREPIS